MIMSQLLEELQSRFDLVTPTPTLTQVSPVLTTWDDLGSNWVKLRSKIESKRGSKSSRLESGAWAWGSPGRSGSVAPSEICRCNALHDLIKIFPDFSCSIYFILGIFSPAKKQLHNQKNIFLDFLFSGHALGLHDRKFYFGSSLVRALGADGTRLNGLKRDLLCFARKNLGGHLRHLSVLP